MEKDNKISKIYEIKDWKIKAKKKMMKFVIKKTLNQMYLKKIKRDCIV